MLILKDIEVEKFIEENELTLTSDISQTSFIYKSYVNESDNTTLYVYELNEKSSKELEVEERIGILLNKATLSDYPESMEFLFNVYKIGAKHSLQPIDPFTLRKVFNVSDVDSNLNLLEKYEKEDFLYETFSFEDYYVIKENQNYIITKNKGSFDNYIANI